MIAMKNGSSETEQYSGLELSIRGVLVLQFIAAIVVLFCVTVYALSLQNDDFLLIEKLKASVYGSALAISSTILSARSMRRTGHTLSGDESGQSQFSMAPIFSGLLNKLVIVGGGIGFGLIIGLSPIFVIASYLVVQIAASARLVLSEN